ncbi:MAG: glutaredoxin family protein [Actinomycetota bacterium]
MPQVIQLTLFTKPGCHLCDEAKMVLDTVVSQIRSENAGVWASVQFSIDEKNILEDQGLVNLYSEEIPVLQINGETHAYWRIDPERLLQALRSKIL